MAEFSLEALGTIVEGHAKEISEIRTQITGLGDRMGGAIQNVLNKIDNQQNAYAASRGTNWQSIAAICSVLLGIVGMVGGIVLSQINSDLSRHDIAIEAIKTTRFSKDDARQMSDGITRWLGELSAEQREQTKKVSYLEGVLEERQAAYLREYASIQSSIRTIDGDLIKRPEIGAANHNQGERTDALSARLNDVQGQLNSLFPASKTIDEMWAQLREARGSAGGAPLTPVVPITPISPAKPPGD